MAARKLNPAMRKKAQRLHDRDCPAVRDLEQRCTWCATGVCPRHPSEDEGVPGPSKEDP